VRDDEAVVESTEVAAGFGKASGYVVIGCGIEDESLGPGDTGRVPSGGVFILEEGGEGTWTSLTTSLRRGS